MKKWLKDSQKTASPLDINYEKLDKIVKNPNNIE